VGSVTGTLRIGELAEATGLTVRTLRHYEAVGLLEPVQRSESGYRRYRAEDAERLYTIVALRRLGLSLAQIRATLVAEPAGLRQMLARHASDVRDRIAALAELEAVIERVQRELGADGSPSLSDVCDLVRLTVELQRRDLGEEPEALRVLSEPLSGAVLECLQRCGPATAAEMPADKSPSEIKRIRAPAALTSLINFLCRERSSTITVRSSISRPRRRAMFFRLSFTGASMSTTPRDDGPTTILSM